ncbi:MAG: bifunctional DNA-formamidopyrimidine glycosylase/DNA-(apurinic or apyrimidinic site) lyase [Caulobacteraceae bacterium]|nr:bifunctional DNA-formamidopyrimidine glycosylase/DNA-(apurinic or apyrimidinic site) lyase [Caulobacter sp.]
MPELPEVETVRRGLAPHLDGARIARAEQRRPDLRFPFPARFAQRLTGARIAALRRRAKYLLAPLDTGETLVAHLGMTGRFTVSEPGGGATAPGDFIHAAGASDKHDHLVLETEAGVRVTFNDARRFGYMDLLPTDRLEAHAWFAGLGPEPLGEAFDGAHLQRAFAGRTQNVKATLLDQRVVAGLGNIYVCEALHRARIDPATAAGHLSAPRLRKLAQAVREVLEEAIAAGGSTLRDYRTAGGELGYFQHRFRAYGREGEPCPSPRCRGVIARQVQAGRSTFHCPVCQR